MILQEVILCATTSLSSGVGTGYIALHDAQTGTQLSTFKHTNAAPHCTAYVETRSGEGGLMLAAQPDTSILNVYSFQKDQLALKIVLPERLSCLAVDSQGSYCAGGTSQGRIYIWEVSSGILFNSWDAHYRQVTVLRFTSDGLGLVSGSEDSAVSVWSLNRLVDNELHNSLPIPFCTFSDHTLPITDIKCGIGSFTTGRILTSSLDHAVKIWDLASKSLLTTFQFPQPITALAWDVTERLFFASSLDGSIHQVNLFRKPDAQSSQMAEAVGGMGAADTIRIDYENREAQRKRLIVVGQPITSLSISLTSSTLVVGTSIGLIHSYDIPSHQLIRTINSHKGLTISFLTTMLKPPDLTGHINLSLTVGSAADSKDTIPIKPILPFQRTRDAKSRDAHEVTMLLPHSFKPRTDDNETYIFDEMYQDHAFFVRPNSSPLDQDTITLQSRIAKLEAEVQHLQNSLGKAKGVNDMMWDNIVQKIVRPKQQSDDHQMAVDDVNGTQVS